MSPLEVMLWSALAIIVLCVAIELAARAWLARFGKYHVWPPYARTRMEIDRETLPSLGPVAHFEINQEGERGAMAPADWSRTYRVLVAGGSVAECYFLDQPSSWPEVIRRILNQPENLARLGAERAHVGNISRSLVACEHIDLILQRVLPRYERLDAVLFMVGASDLVHWLEKRTPAVIEDEPIPPGRLFARHPEGPFGWGPKTLALRRIASHWNKRLRRPIDVRTRAGKSLAEARRMRQRAREILTETPDPALMLDHFEKYLREMITRARAKAKRVIVVRQPWFEKPFTPEEEKLMWSFGAGRPYSEVVTVYYAHAAAWRLMKLVDERAARVAREMGVEELDLMPLLPRNLEIYYDELHHTPKGCELVGAAVAAKILGPEPNVASAGRARVSSHAERKA